MGGQPLKAARAASRTADGRSARYVFTVWGGIAALSAAAALVGFPVFATAPGAAVAFVTTVAAGAILAMTEVRAVTCALSQPGIAVLPAAPASLTEIEDGASMTARPSAPPRRMGRRLGRPVLLACLGLGVTLGMLSAGAVPANAVSEFREQIPLQAGSHIAVGESRCTVGAVLVSTSWYASLIPSARATRYIVTAGHCGEVGDPIRVNYQGVIGSVVWKSAILDAEIAQIDPLPESRAGCDPSSTLHRCTVSTTYTPRAIGRIFLFDPAGRYSSLPVTGMGAPAANEVFCTSGAHSGVNCTWGAHRLPPGAPPHVLGARTFRNQVEDGDSGGPVASRSGTLYGIISEGMYPHDPDPDFMSYVPLTRILQEQSGYALAPSS